MSQLLYHGDGRSPATSHAPPAPPVSGEESEARHPRHYLAGAGLRNAVNVALALGQPLLLTGEPGAGKTQLAYSLQWELGLPLEIFYAKTTSLARDLFYRYDSLRHFHTVNMKSAEIPVRRFIQIAALGRAILRGAATPDANAWLSESECQAGPVRSIVLIDEIDKAPRDLPNDVLNEFERMEFSIEELEARETHRAAPGLRPILILTSNSEKNLPDAFLRRCVYYHIPPPDKADLQLILERRLGRSPGVTPALLHAAIEKFTQEIKLLGLKKPPGTAECIAWVEVLAAQGIDLADPARSDKLAASFCVLAKNREDLDAMQKRLGI